MEFYCETDALQICSLCAIKGAHRDHSIITLDEQVNTLQYQPYLTTTTRSGSLPTPSLSSPTAICLQSSFMVTQ